MKYSCLDWGYNLDTNQKIRKSSDDEWFCYNINTTSIYDNFKNACLTNANLISQSTKLPIQILTSGSISSMAVCESFRQMEINFEVFTYKFDDNSNLPDVERVIDYCKYYGIKYNVLDVNLKRFFKKHLNDYTEPIMNKIPYFAFYCWCIDQMDGYPVLGNGLIQIEVHDINFFINEREQSYYDEKWFYHKGREGCPRFYSYTPEILYSQVTDPFILKYVKYFDYKSSWTGQKFMEWKKNMFKSYFPSLSKELVGFSGKPNNSRKWSTARIIEHYKDKLNKKYDDVTCDENCFITYRDFVMSFIKDKMEWKKMNDKIDDDTKNKNLIIDVLYER